MRKETLIYLATLALSVVAGIGQVSYASIHISSGYNLLANPLSTGVTNGANEIMPSIDGEEILTWNNGLFNVVMYDSIAGGWVLEDDVTPTAPPSLPPGKGFFLFNPGPATNLTFIGQAVPGLGTTNSVKLPSGYSLVGSPLPASVTNITSAPVNLPLIDGMQILTWTGIAYSYTSYDSGFGGWIGADFKPKAAPSYSVGQGFFFFNPGPATTWEQSLP